jgi:gliding motility-associated-like protein
MKKILLFLFICVVAFTKSFAQFTADLDGFPLVTTGWNIGGFGTVVDSTVRLTSPSTTQNGYVYYNTPVNLTGCGQFTVDFDYRIQVSPTSTVADGIAFWYISNPPSGFSTGGGIGLPSFANGLIMIMDTYDNTAPVNVPLATLLGYDGSIAGYTEGSTAGLLAPVVGTLPYITDGTWRHCKITYNVGTVNVYFNYSATPTLTGFYPLTISGYFGFSSSTGAAYSTQSVKSIHITALISLPVPTVTTPVTYCQDDVAVPVTATPVTGATIRWFSTDTALVVSLPGAPTPSTAVPGTYKYYVRQTAGTCISPADSVTVIVNPRPDPPTITGATIYCQNQTFIPFTVTGAGILWYTAATGGTGSATAPVVPTAVPGTYKYYASQTLLGCESYRDSIEVVVNPTPATPVLLAGSLTYCQFETFIPYVVSGINTLWYTSATGGTGTPTAPVINTSTAGVYDYYVTQTSAEGCESARLHLHITVYAKPPVPTVAPITHCQYSLAPPVIAGGTGLTWYGPGPTPGTPIAPVPSTALTGTYNYYVTQTIDGCVSDSAMLPVTIDSTPVTSYATSNSPVCEGDTLHLRSSSLTAGVFFGWGGPNFFVASDSVAHIPNVTLAAAGFYTVTVTLGACSSSSLVSVVVTPLPPVLITSNSPVCSGVNDTIKLHAVSNPGATFTWTGPYVFTSNAQDPVRNPVSTEHAGVYHVTAVLDGCTATTSHTVVVNPTPPAPWVKWLTYCQYYDAPYLQAFGSNILWYSSAAPGAVGSPVPPKPQTNTLGITFYYANQTVLNCPSAIDSIRVTINPSPTVTVSPDAVVCPLDSVQLVAVNTDAIAYYHWYPPMYLSDTAGDKVTARPETDMEYYVVSSNMYGCTDTATVSVRVKANAVIHLEDSVTLYPGENYQINPMTNCSIFSWTPSGGLNSKYVSNPVAAPQVSTKYVVTGVTEWGCKTKDSINVYINTEPVLSVPNAFAPGGVNGKFRLIKRGFATLRHFRIYDRWGVVVFETSNIEEGWDGTYKGVPQPLGVYVYDISAISSTGNAFSKTGNLTLLR